MGWRRATASSRRVRPRFQAMSLSKAGRMSSLSWRAMVLMSSWMDMEVQSAPGGDRGPGVVRRQRWLPGSVGDGFRIAAGWKYGTGRGKILRGQNFTAYSTTREHVQRYAESRILPMPPFSAAAW